MEKKYDEDDEMTITEEQSQRLVEWFIKNGHGETEAYECLAYVMNATPAQHKVE